MRVDTPANVNSVTIARLELSRLPCSWINVGLSDGVSKIILAVAVEAISSDDATIANQVVFFLTPARGFTCRGDDRPTSYLSHR